MARIRSVKPELFTSETIAALPLSTRWTFVGLWCHVDDNGVTIDNDRLINAAIWPLEENPLEALRRTREDLRALGDAGLIQRYEHSGRRYLYVSTWDEHQRVSHPGKPRYPRPDEDGCTPLTSDGEPLPQPSGGSPETLVSPPEILVPEQGAGNREQGARNRETSEAPPPSSEIATRPSDPPRLDVEKICTHLADRIEGNGAKRPTVTKKWRDAARLMLDRDGRPEQEIHAAIDWCQDHEFWRSNILSLPKLREKYDAMSLQARRPHGTGRGEPAPGGQRMAEHVAHLAQYATQDDPGWS